jgi:ribosomal-protein-alanine N-acetyltransferase
MTKHTVLSKRLLLRPLLATDITQDYIDWINDPDINQFLESRFDTHTLDSVTKYVQKFNNESNFLFGIFYKDSMEHIGNLHLGPINPTHLRSALGIVIGNTKYWKKGIAQEAIEAITDYSFNKLNLCRIEAGCYEINTASKKAFLNAGFIVDGVFKEHAIYNNERINSVFMSKNKR